MTEEWDLWPLSPLQEGFLFHALFDEHALDVYTIQLVFDLEGVLDSDRLRIAAQTLLDRHSCLRTAIALDQEPPMQVVVRGVQVPWVEVDLSGRPYEERSRRFARLVEEDRITRFDMRTVPLLRFQLVKIGEARHRLVFSVHHILLDGWSMPLLLGELFALYASGGDGSALPVVRPYSDYLMWLSTRDRAAASAAWAQTLKGLTKPTLLAAADRDRPPVIAEQVQTSISEDMTSRLTAFARTQGLMLNILVHAAWAVMLSRSVGRLDVVFGTTVSGRPADITGVESMIGLFINTIPVRVRFDPHESLVDLLHRIQDEQFRLLDYQYVGLAELQREVGLDVMFDTLTVFQSYPVDIAEMTRPLTGTGVSLTGIERHDSTHYPICLIVEPGTCLHITLEYRPDLFDSASAQSLADRVVRVLELMVADPGVRVGDIDVLSAHERHRMLVEWNDTAVDVPAASLPELVAAQVAQNPNAIAVVCGDKSVTYAELSAWASRLADHLIRNGAAPERVVAVCLERSVALVVALLGVLKAGAAFVALEPSWPRARIEQVCRSSAAMAAVRSAVSGDWATDIVAIDIDDLPESDGPGSSEDVPVHPEGLAYVIFTSGSTGAPKGAMIRHAAIAARLCWQRDLLGFGTGDAALFKAPLGFDISINEVFLPLVSGARLVLAEPGGERDIEYLLELIERERVTFVYMVSSMLDLMLELPDVAVRAQALKHLWCGGEALSPALFDRFQACLDATMYHGYGPAEATIGVTHQLYRPGEARDGVTIGRPNPNTRIYLLDESLSPVPIGVTGELYAGGLLLGRGYVNDPAQTASRFVADPFSVGERLYRTGDLARWRPDGILEFRGRADNQVKIRGMRVELEEIEVVLEGHPQVRQAVVTTHITPGGTTQLIGYCLITHEDLDHNQLKSWAANRLPDHMLPTTFVTLRSMPLTSNGKIDRQALPLPNRTEKSSASRAPVSTEERTLCELFATVLGLSEVSVDDDFFELGGDSIIAIRLVSRARKMNLSINPRWVFQYRTPAVLAALGVDTDNTMPVTASVPNQGGFASDTIAPWPDPLPPLTSHCGENILLTGATGFFGAFLLREILAQYQGTAHCLVRAESATQAWDKLRATLRRYRLSDEMLLQDRVRIISGDLSRPGLGLGVDDYEYLADKIDLIIHNGALVNVLYSYETLKSTNVHGTRELLQLAATTWRKPLRLVSTHAAAEYRPSTSGKEPGYLESKWRAEQIVMEARAQGIPAAVYRVPRLSGDSVTGLSNDRDIIVHMVRSILDLGIAPDVQISEEWIPVDEAARLLVSPDHDPENSGSFVLTSPRQVRFLEIVDEIRKTGCQIECKPVAEWCREAASRSVEQYEMLALVLGIYSANGMLGDNVPDLQGRSPFDGFVPILARGVTEQILQRYLHAIRCSRGGSVDVK
jgi:amino acid adenylation domain-containing protein/thioester reductase-like protein